MSSTSNDSGLSPADRKTLKALAHSLNPVVMIGDKGLTPAVLKEIDVSLAAHQLIKIRVAGDDRQFRIDLLGEITEATGAQAVQHIGKLLVIYRADADKPLISPPAKKSSRRSASSDTARTGERTRSGSAPRAGARAGERSGERAAPRGTGRPAGRGDERGPSRSPSRAPAMRRDDGGAPRRPRTTSARDDLGWGAKPSRPQSDGDTRRAPVRRSAAAGTGSASSPTRDRPASGTRTTRSTPRADDRTGSSRPPVRRPKRPA